MHRIRVGMMRGLCRSNSALICFMVNRRAFASTIQPSVAMSLHNTVFPGDLQAQKRELEHVPINVVQPTQSGGIHLHPGQHLQKANELHEQKLQEQGAGTSQSYCDFAKWGVNPDVIPCNAATLAMVRYKGKEITMGQTLLVKDTQTPPEISWAPSAPITGTAVSGTPQLYTLIMCDPDAPSNRTPTFRNWLHWCVVNIPGSFNINQGHEICTYMGPAPPPNTGLHRYVFLVYAQKGVIGSDAVKKIPDSGRKSWKVDQWLAQHRFAIDGGVPVAGNMFRCQNEHQTQQSTESALPDRTPATKQEAERNEKAALGKK